MTSSNCIGSSGRPQRVEVELERPPLPLGQRRVTQRAEPAFAGSRGGPARAQRPPRLESVTRSLSPFKRLRPPPSRRANPPLRYRRHASCSLGKPLPRRQVDARDLEERDLALVAQRNIPPRRQAGPPSATSAKPPARRRERLLQWRRHPSRSPSGERGPCRPPSTRALTGHVLDPASQALRVVRRPNIARRTGQRDRNPSRSEARDLLDQVDLASDVPGPPRRQPDPSPVDTEPEAPQDSHAVHPGASPRPIEGVGALRPEAERRTTGSSPSTSARPTHSRPPVRRSACVASDAACSGEIGIDALLPAVRALRTQLQTLQVRRA